jgi:hypothetical protein
VRGITPAQQRVLAHLAPHLAPRAYLAGGVAIATVLGHRLSRDLDLFVPHDFDPERLQERLVDLSDLRVTGVAKGTLHLEIEGVPTSVLSYRYPLLRATESREGIALPVASLDDLACMKVSAIGGRGAAKDFWDLSELLRHGVAHGDLATLLAEFQRKYPTADVGHAVRSLAYFGDADAAPLPDGLTPSSWETIKQSFRSRVRALPLDG